MIKKSILFLFFAGWFFPTVYSQTDDSKITLAILPFINKAQDNIQGKVSAIEEMVTSEFAEKKRFVVLDRGKFDKLLAEQNTQKGETFINSKVVEQGKVLGAQYLVTGVISEFSTKQVLVANPTDYSNPNATKGSHYENRLNLKMSFQVIKVETGQTISNITINKDNYKDEPSIICNAKKDVRNEIRKLFPVEMKILQVEKIDKKGLPEQVLITGGAEIFGDKSVKEKGCAGESDSFAGLVGGIFGGSGKTVLQVYIQEKIGDYTREKEVGEVKLEKTEGELAICNVKKGAKEIQEKLNEGKKLLLKIIKN